MAISRWGVIAVAGVFVAGCSAQVDALIRTTTARIATDDLSALGHRVRGGLACGLVDRGRPDRADLLVVCTGSTDRGERIRLRGVIRRPGEVRTDRDWLVSVGGRHVIRASCLACTQARAGLAGRRRR